MGSFLKITTLVTQILLLVTILTLLGAGIVNSSPPAYSEELVGSRISFLGTLQLHTQVYEGKAILVAPPGVRLVSMEAFANNHIANGSPLKKTIFLEKPPKTPFQFATKASGPTMDDVLQWINASKVNLTGQGVVVGIVDTGVDFLSKSLGFEKIAFDEKGFPMLFDADSFGLAITPLNVTYRNPYTKMLATKDNYVEIFIPTYGKARVYIDFDWAAPPVESKSGYYKFGFMVAFSFPGNYLLGGSLPGIGYLVPAVMVDTEEPGVYDTVFLDLSSTWFTIGGILYAFGALAEPPQIDMLDFSFRDEKPLKLGEGMAGIDLNGDNVYDFSLGVISGYVYDAFGVINKTGFIGEGSWETAWEPLASGVYPGLDPQGRYFSLFYDPLGHGTSVASIIAGKPTKYYIPSTDGLAMIESRGIAPNAKIAAANALFAGNVVAALYWLSGHDYKNGTWEYTGSHRADIISNSWGILYWQATLLADGPGFIPGSDPLSYHLENITKRTIVVFAAGNEGPGMGSIAMGGASSVVITVGASTIFGKPIYDSFGHLLIPQGIGGGIVSWSSRGPTASLSPKPDVVAPGAYALIPSATINGLGDGTRAIDVFGGTSMAAPVVAGSLALLVQKAKNEGLYPLLLSQVKELLYLTSTDLGYPSYMQGSGILNLGALLNTVNHDKALVSVKRIERHGETIRVTFSLKTSDTPVLKIYNDRQVIIEKNVKSTQYETTFVDLDVNKILNYYDKGVIEITVETLRDIANQSLPYTIVWVGGWYNNSDAKNDVEKLVLLDHSLLSGKRTTLYVSLNQVKELREKGMLYKNRSLRILIISMNSNEEELKVKASLIKEVEMPPKIMNGTKVEFSARGLPQYSIQSYIELGKSRIPIVVPNQVKLSRNATVITIDTVVSTHSAYLTGLGDLYVVELGNERQRLNTRNAEGTIVGYVIKVISGRADLYVAKPQSHRYNDLSEIVAYHSTHPPGYMVSKEAYFPYLKASPGNLVLPLSPNDEKYRLVVYAIDSQDGKVVINISPIIVNMLSVGGRTYLSVYSQEPLGPILVMPAKVPIYHDGYIATMDIVGSLNVGELLLLKHPMKKMEAYVGDIGVITQTYAPGDLVRVDIRIREVGYIPV